MKTSKKDKQKRILVLNWRDIKHPLGGGAEISLHEHAKYWVKKGCVVDWYASSWKGAKRTERIDGITIRRLGSHYTVHLLAFLEYIRGRMSNYDVVVDCFHFLPYFSPLYIRNSKIVALINEPAKNVWFKNLFFPASLVGYLSESLFFIPYRKKQFITSAESIKEELVKDFKVPAKNINIIPHGVTLPKVLPKAKKEKNPTIIYCSRITRDKGIEDAIEAISILTKEIPNLQFWVVGKAEKEEYLLYVKNLAQQKNISDITTFFGFVSEGKKFELLSKAWVLIHPSIREGWGLNVIEANAVGTPAVGYDVSGLRNSIQHGKTGFLSKIKPTSLAREIQDLIIKKSMYSKISKNATDWSMGFDWEKTGSKSYQILYKNEK